MANALSEFIGNSNLPALSNEDMAAALQESLNENASGGGDVDYLSFSGKTGAYSLGRDKDDMDPETMYLLEPQSLIEGWVSLVLMGTQNLSSSLRRLSLAAMPSVISTLRS